MTVDARQPDARRVDGARPRAARVAFLYLGRRGAMPRFLLDLPRTIGEETDLFASFFVSERNELHARYLAQAGGPVASLKTFGHGLGALVGAPRIPGLRSSLVRTLRAQRIEALVNLMPHVWTPFLLPAVRKAGIATATLVHDADPHPGDVTGLALRWCNREARSCDRVFTLSHVVRERLIASGRVEASSCVALFHPDFVTRAPATGRSRRETQGRPLRLLFFGRILPYKGLGLFVEALERLAGEGVRIEIGVFGEGSLHPYGERLARLGATIENRWIGEHEIAGILASWDAVALSHVEASQSGVASLAFGAGLPVVATPVGGLVEQVADGIDGVLATAATPAAFAHAIRRLSDDPALLATTRRHLETRADHSMRRFVDALVGHLPRGTE